MTGFVKPGSIPLEPQEPKDRGSTRRNAQPRRSKEFGAGRRCEHCDAPLSRYNPDDTCRLCWERAKRIEADS